VLSTIELPSNGVQACQVDRKRIRSGSASTGAAFSLHDWHARSPLRWVLMRLVALADPLMW